LLLLLKNLREQVIYENYVLLAETTARKDCWVLNFADLAEHKADVLAERCSAT
jgi:hypothetical protein